jgi:hypothetical protein
MNFIMVNEPRLLVYVKSARLRHADNSQKATLRFRWLVVGRFARKNPGKHALR